MVTHRQMPYATLMYIWENRAPTGTVITSTHTGRIKMIVVESGEANVGAWDYVTRNLYEDYKSAFGEEPKQVRWIGVMTDTDNTGKSTRAFYGDIRLERASVERLP